MKHALFLSSWLGLLAATRAAQGPAFQTPGTPVYPTPSSGPADSGQADRFASVFNPAFSFVVDATADYVDFDDSADGFDAELRILEASAQAWVDPKAWAYFIAAAEEEELTIEEAALHYSGLADVGLENSTLRAGRFFIDFGKQMQIHVHELRTLERPLVLRAYLGPEVAGDGVQWDHWIPAGDTTAVRWSLGVFSSLLPEEAEFATAEVTREVAERKGFGELSFTARVTGFGDVGSHGTLQLGASLRAIPEFDAVDEVNGLTEEGLDETVVGLDATYGWVDDTGERRLTLGGEALVVGGDTGFDLVDPDTTPGTGDETLLVLDESVFGYYAFADYAWDRAHSAGLQFSAAEIPDASGSDASELELYFTRWFSEFHRLRFGVAALADDTREDGLRLALQYTGIVGAHGHGTNW